MIIDSKERFRKGPHAKAWNDITDTAAFTLAAETAMLTMLSTMPNDSPAANYTRLEGARHFLGILCNLTTEKKQSPQTHQNLATNQPT